MESRPTVRKWELHLGKRDSWEREATARKNKFQSGKKGLQLQTRDYSWERKSTVGKKRDYSWERGITVRKEELKLGREGLKLEKRGN